MWWQTWLTEGMATDADARWNELLLAAAAGNAEASRRFFVWARTEIEPLCRLLGDADSVDDLIQETNERIIASMHRFRGDGPAEHWVRQITRRVCADSVRRRERTRRRDRRLEGETVADAHHDLGTTELDDVLDRLDPDRRDAFVLTQVLGLSYAEAADVIDCPIGTVRSRVARARMDLMEHLEGSGFGVTERSA
jgi:RNA polymerase sigma-70 factor (ECF subfamily)